MHLLGDLFGKPEAAAAYGKYFDETMKKVSSRVDALRDDQRPRVLYANYRSLTQPHKMAEWWIAKAGGHSVTDDGRVGEAFNFSVEQILAWNPEVIIVTSESEIASAYGDARLANVSAIKNKRVYAIPMGVHVWGNRTVERPGFTVLWAAKLFHPDLFADALSTTKFAISIPRSSKSISAATILIRFWQAVPAHLDDADVEAGRPSA